MTTTPASQWSETESSRLELRVAAPHDGRELDALLDALMPLFNMTSESAQQYGAIVGAENFRIAWSRQTLAGGLAVLPMGQYFGGKSVPMTGIAAVGVRPEFRGTGVATRLMRTVVQEIRSRGAALSTLYPATLPLYRRAGYEQAGSKFEVTLPLRMLALKQRSHQIRRIVDADRAQIEGLYRRRATCTPGYLERSAFIWTRVRHPRGVASQGYLAVNPASSEAEGYLYYTQKDSAGAPYLLSLTDFVAATPDAARSLLTFLREHQSMADVAIWHGGAIDPVVQLLPERIASVKLTDHWMLRIIDVGAALAARGYPPGLRTELHIDVHDDVVASNNGRYVLEVGDGGGRVRAGGTGDLRVDIRGLAALYSGFMSAEQLHMSGLLSVNRADGGPGAADAMANAGAIFAGAAPVLCDGF